MKRNSVCLWFLLSIGVSGLASASEDNTTAKRIMEFQANVRLQNKRLGLYEVGLSNELVKQGLQYYYENRTIGIFYFPWERALLRNVNAFPNYVHQTLEDVFKHAGQILVRYFATRHTFNMTPTLYLKTKLVALYLALNNGYQQNNMDQYVETFHSLFPREFSQTQFEHMRGQILGNLQDVEVLKDSTGKIEEPMQLLTNLIRQDECGSLFQ